MATQVSNQDGMITNDGTSTNNNPANSNLFDGGNKKSKSKVSWFSTDSKWFSVGLFVLCAFCIAGTPRVMYESFIVNGKVNKLKYAQPTVHSVSFGISLVVSNVVTLTVYGVPMWIKSWSPKVIIFLFPVSFGYSLSEFLALLGVSMSEAFLYTLTHKCRLIITMVLTHFFLPQRPKQPLLLWLIAILITLVIMTYVLLRVSIAITSTKWELIKGILFLFCNILISAACAIYADWAYKKLKIPLSAQFTAGRFTAFISSSLMSTGYITIRGWWPYGFFGGPGGGYDFRVWFLICWNIARDWITTMNLLWLTAIWKAIAAIIAMVIQFFMEIIFFGVKPTVIECFIVATIVLGVSTYTWAKHVDGKFKALVTQNKQLQAQVSTMQASNGSCPATTAN